ncbi:MAG: DUF1911 domain-containing protein [Bacteroidia bacterium]|nr:DUF1911 domain-containing protein [Bacteroidia bacterium]
MERREVFMVMEDGRYLDHWDAAIQNHTVFTTPEGIFSAYQLHLARAVCLYSQGNSHGEVAVALGQALKFLSAYPAAEKGEIQPSRDKETYQWILHGLGLAILFNENLRTFKDLFAGKDALIDHLLQLAGQSLTPNDFLQYSEPYRFLLRAAKSPPGEAEESVVRFLRNYYEGLEGVSWYESHKTNQASFFGYWSFEMAAVVKLRGISDVSFADNIFYPRDLVGAVFYRTWLDSEEGEAQRKVRKLEETQASLLKSKQVLKEYFASAMQGKAPAQGGLENLSSELFGHLMGVDEESLTRDPALLKIIMQQFLSSMLNLSGEVVELSKGVESNDPQLKKILDEYRKAEKELNQGLNPQDFLEQLPPEIREKILQADPQASMEEIQAKFTSIGSSLNDLIRDEELEIEEFAAGMDKLMAEFYGPGGQPPAYDGEAEVRKEVRESLNKDREKNSLDNFDWSTLWKKEE